MLVYHPSCSPPPYAKSLFGLVLGMMTALHSCMIHVSPLRPSSRIFPQVMFGLAVGMMTEYATGVDFPNQLRLLCSYLGVLDLE